MSNCHFLLQDFPHIYTLLGLGKGRSPTCKMNSINLNLLQRQLLLSKLSASITTRLNGCRINITTNQRQSILPTTSSHWRTKPLLTRQGRSWRMSPMMWTHMWSPLRLWGQGCEFLPCVLETITQQMELFSRLPSERDRRESWCWTEWAPGDPCEHWAISFFRTIDGGVGTSVLFRDH